MFMLTKRTSGARVVVAQGALARLRLAHRNAGSFAQAPQRFRRLRVDDAPAGHDHGPAGSLDRGRGTFHRARIRQRTSYVPDPLPEERFRIVEGLCLHVLREREGNGPVSAWSVSTRIAARAAPITCSGREILSQYRDTGLKQSLTERVPSLGVSSCCRTGSGPREAKTSPGRRSTGRRLIVARAAPVTMLVAPGPMEVVQAKVWRRSFWRAWAEAVCTIACSLRAW